MNQKILQYNPKNRTYVVKPPEKRQDYFFCSDLPSDMVAGLERDLAEEEKRGFRSKFVVIKTNDYYGTNYEWLPFTLAMHTLILAPDDIKVVIEDETAKCLADISRRIDLDRGIRMQCLKNFSIYTNVVNDNRAPRVFLKSKNTKDGFVSCYDEIRSERHGNFSSYYVKWLRTPWDEGGFYTHPFDHLPVKNIGPLFKGFKTAKQWEKEGRRILDEKNYLLAHPQMENVCVKRYYDAENTTTSTLESRPAQKAASPEKTNSSKIIVFSTKNFIS